MGAEPNAEFPWPYPPPRGTDRCPVRKPGPENAERAGPRRGALDTVPGRGVGGSSAEFGPEGPRTDSGRLHNGPTRHRSRRRTTRMDL